MRSRVVQVDTQKITAARRGREVLKLNLFDDAVVEVQIKRVRPTRNGYFISGRPSGMDWGEVRLVVNGPVMVGTVITPKGKFTIRSGGAGRHVIRRIDPMAEPFVCDVEEGPLPAPPTQVISSLGPPPLLAAPPTPQADDMPTEDGSEIRILIVYTPALQAAQGGAAGMRALIDLFVQSANQAFEESGINTRLELAHSALVDYVAQGAGPDLGRLIFPDDGYMDDIHALRNEHAADLVHLLTNVGFGAEGVASPLTRETLVSERSAAFAVTANSQEQTFTHEIGHNLGVMHDRYSFGSNYPRTIYPFAFGYVNQRAFEPGAPDTSKWRTIMSTQDRCQDERIRCPRLLRFANPDQSYMGDALGISAESTVSGPDGPADARTTINSTARWVGSFRSEACTAFNVRLETPFAPVDGGEVILKVDAAPGCLWEATSQADFLTISSGARHAGTTLVNVEVKANPTNAERIGSLTVAGTDIMVRQLATADGVCGRTPAVAQAITRAAGFGNASRCDEVTAEQLAGITSLKLQGQAISSLKTGDLEGLSGLVTLELYTNRLKELPDDVFSDLPSLDRLSLSGNMLAELPTGLFSGLSSLRDLQLSHNQLTELPEGIFSGLSNLEDLDLSSNQLTALSQVVFSGLAKLGDLRLRSNRLPSLPEGVFSDLSELQTLGLGSNQLTDLPAGLFAGLSELRDLQLFHNQLTDLPEGIFSGLSNLEDLSISSNQLNEIPEGLFSGLSNLKTLILAANQLVQMGKGTFATLHNLQHLNLGSNQLTDLHGDLFDGLSNLKTLSLERNKLESLPVGVFSGLTALKSLNVRSNRVDPLSALVSLRLDADNAITANIQTGAPFTLELPISVSEAGALEGDASTIAISVGRVESESVSVMRQAGMQDPVTADMTMPALPAGHFGYALQKDETLPLRVLPSLLPGDAALTGLSVSGGTLDPPFRQDETSYRIFVANSVSAITVTPITSNSSATVAFRGTNDGTLADADAATPGHQASLVEGENAIKIHVTSEDGMSSRSYTLIAVRDGRANVCVRTPQVRDAIMKASGVGACTEVTASHLSGIARLEIRNNDLTFLASGDFAGLTALDYLDLRFNRLSSLPEGLFSGLTALQTLHLYDNRLTNLSADVFSGLTTLQRLSLGSNRMTALPDGLLRELTGLKRLGLGSNRLSNLPDNALSELSALETLDLRSNRFKRMLPRWFTGLPALQTLFLDGNYLSGLPLDMFTGLNSLQVLDLGDNRLARLPADVFTGLAKLENLNLSGNRISNLPVDLFSGLSALQRLRLDENRLSSLPVGIFSSLSALQFLHVQRNAVDPLVLSVSLEKIGGNQFKAVAPAGAPFTLEISLSISGPGMIDGDASAVAIPAGALESVPLGVSRVAGTEDAVSVDIASLPGLPENHVGYSLERDEALPRVILPAPRAPPPSAVSSVEIAAGIEQLEVSWTAVSDANGYKVQWKSGTEAYNEDRQAVISTGDTTNYTITRLSAGAEYAVRVIATRENADDGTPSSEVAGIPKASAPAQVTGVVIAVDIEELSVTWSSISDADGYKVQWKSDPEDYGETRQVVLTGGETVSHTIAGLTEGAVYTVRIIATKAHADDGLPSEEVTGIPRAAAPAQVMSVEVAAGVEQLEVTWTEVSDAGGYKVHWKSGDESYDEARQAVISAGAIVSHTITGLTAGTEYTVRVIAVMANADDALPSSKVTGVPKAQPPEKVTEVAVEAGVGELEVSWMEVSDADGYKVHWKSGDEEYDDSRQAVLSGSDMASHSISGLIAGTEYTVRVIATKAHADDGAPSGEVSGTPKSEPPAQVTGVAAAVGVEQLQVFWTAVSDADGYKVQWKQFSEGYSESRQAVVAGGGTNSYSIMDLTPGAQYSVRVIATKLHADDGAPSEEVTGTPKATPPAQVTGVAAEPGFEELGVSWDAVSDADGYKVQWKSGTEDYDEARQVALLGGETTRYTIIDLTADTQYTIRVIATKAHADDGEPSEEVTATPVSADPDVNGDGMLNGNDALILYHSYASSNQLGDGETGGTAESRQSLLAGYSGKADPSDEELKAMIRKANAWKEGGVDSGGDINEDGGIDGKDAFVMYYAYTNANLVGDGETGGTERFRRLLLASYASQDNPTDEDLKAMLRRANQLREEFG